MPTKYAILFIKDSEGEVDKMTNFPLSTIPRIGEEVELEKDKEKFVFNVENVRHLPQKNSLELYLREV